MREILFRGKDLNGWVMGSLIIKPSLNKQCEDVYIIYSHREMVVDPETIGQYTGLEDKNGVKIFEGDTIEDDTGARGNVLWYKHCAGFHWGYGGYALTSTERLRVVGNIHDKPELLEVQE